jgi:hypothetical protein
MREIRPSGLGRGEGRRELCSMATTAPFLYFIILPQSVTCDAAARIQNRAGSDPQLRHKIRPTCGCNFEIAAIVIATGRFTSNHKPKMGA